MKKIYNLRSGFTLVELLTTICIIMILAFVSVKGVKSMRRKTADTTCIAHMKDLAQGVMNYYSDFEAYPNAGSYETYDSYEDAYYEHRGWVGWIRSDGKESLRKNSMWTYSSGDFYYGYSKESHAQKYVYVGTGAEDDIAEENVRRSIREGALFKYVKKNFANYSCPMYNNGDSKHAIRTYSMNRYFGGRSNRIGHRYERDFANINRNMMALFVEVAATSGTGKTTGDNGKTARNGKPLADDSIWDYEDEDLGLWHDISGQPSTHVAFCDGHVESIIVKKDTRVKDLCKDLGTAEFKGKDQY